MSEPLSSLAIRLTVTHSSPSDPSELYAQPEDKIFHPGASGQVCIGRSPSNDISLNHAAVSGQHANILRQGDDYFLEDLESRNGTLLNNQRLASREKKLLRSGDLIRIVPYDIRFFSGTAVYEALPPTENTAMIRDEMIRSLLGGVMGHEDTPPKLIVVSGVQSSMQQFELVGMHTEFRIGRSPQCDLVIQDENISREHALVRRSPSGVVIGDLKSRNGVVVNGKRVPTGTEQVLRDRDEITLGTIKLLFSDPEGAVFAGKVEEVVEEPAAPAPRLGGGMSIPQPSSPPPEKSPTPPAAQGPTGVPEVPSPPPGSENAPVPATDSAANASAEADAGTGNAGDGTETPVTTEPVGGLTTSQTTVIAFVVLVVIAVVLYFVLFG